MGPATRRAPCHASTMRGTLRMKLTRVSSLCGGERAKARRCVASQAFCGTDGMRRKAIHTQRPLFQPRHATNPPHLFAFGTLRPATTPCAWPAGQRPAQHVCRHAARRPGPGGQAPRAHGHLRAVRGLLRRVLQARAAGTWRRESLARVTYGLLGLLDLAQKSDLCNAWGGCCVMRCAGLSGSVPSCPVPTGSIRVPFWSAASSESTDSYSIYVKVMCRKWWFLRHVSIVVSHGAAGAHASAAGAECSAGRVGPAAEPGCAHHRIPHRRGAAYMLASCQGC